MKEYLLIPLIWVLISEIIGFIYNRSRSTYFFDRSLYPKYKYFWGGVVTLALVYIFLIIPR